MSLFSAFRSVVDFQRKFCLPVGKAPQLLPHAPHSDTNAILARASLFDAEQSLKKLRTTHPDDQLYGRIQMMIEELREFMDAAKEDDIELMADSLVDLEYFTLGTSAMMGLPHDEIFAEVHRANMDKILVSSAEESRRLNKLDVRKPVGWRPPNLKAILFPQEV